MVAHHINSRADAPSPALRLDLTTGAPPSSGGLRKQTPEVPDLRSMLRVNSLQLGGSVVFASVSPSTSSPAPYRFVGKIQMGQSLALDLEKLRKSLCP